MKEHKNQNSINSIKRAITILNLYKNGVKYLGITEISKIMGLPKSTVYRIVTTLESEGWLQKSLKNDKYKLGFNILDVANQIRKEYSFRDIVLEEMNILCKEVGETVILSTYSNYSGICIEKVETDSRIKLTSEIGRVIPLHCGATGKILLPYIPEKDRNIILKKELEKYTSNTITNPQILIEQVKDIRKKGWVISRAECDEGALGVGAPILNEKGELVYGLSIAGPINRFENKGLKTLIDKVKEAANKISIRINLLSSME